METHAIERLALEVDDDGRAGKGRQHLHTRTWQTTSLVKEVRTFACYHGPWWVLNTYCIYGTWPTDRFGRWTWPAEYFARRIRDECGEGEWEFGERKPPPRASCSECSDTATQVIRSPAGGSAGPMEGRSVRYSIDLLQLGTGWFHLLNFS